MKRCLILLAVLMLWAVPAHAQTAYSQTTVSINSTTVPVQVIPPLCKSTWFIRLRAAGTNPILCFSYTGTIPGSVPANCVSPGSGAGCTEVSAGSPMFDGMNAPVNQTFQQPPFCQGWGCVLSTSGSETADGVYR